MDFREYFMLGETVVTLKQTVSRLLQKREQSNNPKLLEAHNLLEKIQTDIYRGLENLEVYSQRYERASHCFVSHMGESQDSDSFDFDTDISEDEEEEEEENDPPSTPNHCGL